MAKTRNKGGVPKNPQTQALYRAVVALWERSGYQLSNGELAERCGCSVHQAQRAIRDSGGRRRLKGGGRKPKASSAARVAPRPPEQPPLPFPAAGHRDPADAWQQFTADNPAATAEDAFAAGWQAREQAADVAAMVDEALTYLGAQAQIAAAGGQHETARALYRDVLGAADKAARHRPPEAKAATIDPAQLPEVALTALAKLEQLAARLSRQRQELVREQLEVASGQGGDYQDGTLDTLRQLGDLPGKDTGGDDEGR